jgi:hypothetical protein
MQPTIDTNIKRTSLKNKNLQIGSVDEGLSITPDWLKNNLMDQYSEYNTRQDESQHYQQPRPPSPNSPRWANDDEPLQDQTPSSLPASVLGSSPNWIRDNTNTSDNVDYNVYNDQDEEALMHKFNSMKRVMELRVEEKDSETLDELDNELNAVVTPQLYSMEIDDTITLSETHLFRQCLHPNRMLFT